MVAHRFWRLMFDSVIRTDNKQWPGLAELQLYGADGTTRLTTLGGASITSNEQYAPAANAFDNNYSSIWQSGSPCPTWIGWDFGADNAQDVQTIGIVARDNQYNDDGPGYCLKTGGLEWSDDGATWTRNLNIPEQSAWSVNERRLFSSGVAVAVSVALSAGRVFATGNVVAGFGQVSAGRVLSQINFPADFSAVAQARAVAGGKFQVAAQVSQSRMLAHVKGRTANPRVRAWTFTLDGHDFYVLRLGDKETLVYDVSTEQWTQFDSMESGAWRPNTGTTWTGAQRLGAAFGTNVVAGDDTFGLLWFLDPNTGYDDAPDPLRGKQQIPFERIVTGQILANARQQIPCYVVFLDGDNYGLTANDFVPAITLETSDDQGRTFDVHDTLTVVPGVQPQSDTWYSLGQFGSPGRMFRFRDNGIFSRIDSAEMNDAQ